MLIQLLVTSWFALGRLPFALYHALVFVISVFLAPCLFGFALERRKVVLTNLGMCFPEAGVFQRTFWAIAHIYFYVRTFLDRAWLWSGNEAVIRDRVRIVNPLALKAVSDGRPTIFLVPHFLGLDAAWSRLSLELDMVTMYSNQKNRVLNALILAGRSRLGNPLLLSRQQGVRALLMAMKAGRPLYYLPDMDFGERDSVFVTFFGVKAATITSVARLSRLLKARVVPVTTVYRRGRYFVHIHDALLGFPVEDDAVSAQAMNHHIEGWVKANMAQYLWLHKRFKTRPNGEPRIY